jgi:very-short-patch-repair endonuclease
VAGVATLREVVAERLGEGRQDSRLEPRVLRAIKQAVPGYTVHHQEVLEGRVIDMDTAWVAHKIDGEVDGMAVRAASRTKFERQSLRENILGRNGWTIVHFTAKKDDETLVAQVAPLLGL